MHTLQRSKHNSDHHGVIELPRDAWIFFSLVMTRPQNTWTQGLLPLGETLPITLYYFHHHLWIHKENITIHNKTTEKLKKVTKTTTKIKKPDKMTEKYTTSTRFTTETACNPVVVLCPQLRTMRTLFVVHHCIGPGSGAAGDVKDGFI